MAAAASEKVKSNWLDKLACQSCGSTLDRTSSKVHDFCQTRYCNQVCLTRDAASHQLWCCKPLEAGVGEKLLPRLSLSDEVQNIVDQRDKLTSEEQQDNFISIAANEYTRIATVTDLITITGFPAKDAKDAANIKIVKGLIQRIQHLISRFPLPTHLVVFTLQAQSEEALFASQLHLLRLEDLKSTKTTGVEQKDDR